MTNGKEDSDSLKAKVAKGSVWAALEQVCVQGLNFGMGIVLARLLSPNDYGTVALVTIFISIAQVLVGSGLGQALVQKKEIDALDVDSVFYVSMVLSLVMYIALFAGAPLVARYYHVDELTFILRVLALNLIFYAFNSVQNAALFREMKFNLTFRISLATTLVSAAVGISMAYCGFGVWALVWSSVLGTVAGVLARAHYVAWRPHWQFSMERVRPLFQYGSRLMANSLVGAIFGNVYGLVIGRFYTRADLAFVNKGNNIPTLLLSNINSSLIEVSLPALVRLQDDRDRLVSAMRRLLSMGMFVVLPVMTYLAVAAPKMIVFLYGEKWAASIPYMQLACLMMVWGPIGAVNQQGLLAVGRSGTLLKLGIVRNVVSLGILAICLTQSVMTWVVVMTFLFGPFSALIDAWCGSRYLGYRVRRQLVDIAPVAGVCVLEALAALAVDLLPWGNGILSFGLCLAVQGLVAAAVYLVAASAFRLRAVCELAMLMPQDWLMHLPNRIRLQVERLEVSTAVSAESRKESGR